MNVFKLKTTLFAALVLQLSACVDVGEAEQAAHNIIDHAAEVASNNTGDDAGQPGQGGSSAGGAGSAVDEPQMSRAEHEENFWRQPLEPIIEQIAAASELKGDGSCGTGVDAPKYFSLNWTDAAAGHGSSNSSRRAAQLLSCHVEWQARYVARLFPEYVAWLGWGRTQQSGDYSPFMHANISTGPTAVSSEGVANTCSNERGFIYTNYTCYYPNWTEGMVGLDRYPHAQWAISEFYESYQSRVGVLNVHVLWREDNWKAVLRHYLGESGTRDIRSLALYGLAAAKPIHTDSDGNLVGWYTHAHHWASDDDKARERAAYKQSDQVMWRVGVSQGW